MVFWESVIVGNYILAAVGFIANVLFIRWVVCNSSFDAYSRIASFIISSATMSLIISNVISTAICLSYGSYFNSGPCLENGAYKLAFIFHTYGEISIVCGIFILVFERYASVFRPTARLSEKYKIWFSFLILLYLITLCTYLYMMNIAQSSFAVLFSTVFASLLYLLSFLLVMYLFCAAKKKYYKTLGIVSLTERYMLSESYELCRSSLPATMCSLAINIVVFISFWCLIFDVIPQKRGEEYFVLANMTLNLTATLFPLLFLFGSRKIRKKFVRINPFNQQFEMKVDMEVEVRQLDGHLIRTSQTQNEYFDQLNSSWA